MEKITVTRVKRTNRSIEIDWNSNGDSKTSRFYRHSDGRWGVDPELASESMTVQSLLWILANDKEIPKKAARRTATIRYEY